MFHSLTEVELFFQERKKVGIKPGLERMHILLQKCKHPERNIRAIHVAGTNGKGSTIQFLHHALMANGYRVGVFSSPSFTGICGHFLINDEEITEDKLIPIMNQLLPIIKEMDEQQMHPSEFEIITVIAFLYFRDCTDFALIETGMGGRDDTTNCLQPVISIITNVEKDHMTFLGNSLKEITRHKAGIIKEHTPVIVGRVKKESEVIINEEAKRKNSQIYQLFSDFTYEKKDKNVFLWKNKEGHTIQFSLHVKGDHQIENASLALMTLMLLSKSGFPMAEKQIRQALLETKIPGRFEKIWENPTIIIDSAHNIAGMRAFLETVMSMYPEENKKVLFAGFKDKQLKEMIDYISQDSTELTMTTFRHERAATISDLKQLNLNIPMKFMPDWKAYLSDVLEEQADHSIYLVTGSLHFITLVRRFLLL